MEIKKLDDQLSVGAQIEPADVATLKGRGFRAIIVNRPDGEAPDQPQFDRVAAEAKAQGLDVRYVPVISGGLTMDDVDAFAKALDELPGPAFAYCRSGTRSTTLWALSHVGDMPRDEILTRAAAAGYDMSGVLGLSAN